MAARMQGRTFDDKAFYRTQAMGIPDPNNIVITWSLYIDDLTAGTGSAQFQSFVTIAPTSLGTEYFVCFTHKTNGPNNFSLAQAGVDHDIGVAAVQGRWYRQAFMRKRIGTSSNCISRYWFDLPKRNLVVEATVPIISLTSTYRFMFGTVPYTDQEPLDGRMESIKIFTDPRMSVSEMIEEAHSMLPLRKNLHRLWEFVGSRHKDDCFGEYHGRRFLKQNNITSILGAPLKHGPDRSRPFQKARDSLFVIVTAGGTIYTVDISDGVLFDEPGSSKAMDKADMDGMLLNQGGEAEATNLYPRDGVYLQDILDRSLLKQIEDRMLLLTNTRKEVLAQRQDAALLGSAGLKDTSRQSADQTLLSSEVKKEIQPSRTDNILLGSANAKEANPQRTDQVLMGDVIYRDIAKVLADYELLGDLVSTVASTGRTVAASDGVYFSDSVLREVSKLNQDSVLLNSSYVLDIAKYLLDNVLLNDSLIRGRDTAASDGMLLGDLIVKEIAKQSLDLVAFQELVQRLLETRLHDSILIVDSVDTVKTSAGASVFTVLATDTLLMLDYMLKDQITTLQDQLLLNDTAGQQKESLLTVVDKLLLSSISSNVRDLTWVDQFIVQDIVTKVHEKVLSDQFFISDVAAEQKIEAVLAALVYALADAINPLGASVSYQANLAGLVVAAESNLVGSVAAHQAVGG